MAFLPDLTAAILRDGGFFCAHCSGAAVMALALRDLSVLAYANGFTLWHYKAGSHTLADVSATGFLLGAADMLAVGDLMMISGADGARIVAIAPTAEGTIGAVPLG
jgi:outer membrane protein assembly factor BamB